MDLALNNLQRLICHKTQPTNQPPSLLFLPFFSFSKLGVVCAEGRAGEYTEFISAEGL